MSPPKRRHPERGRGGRARDGNRGQTRGAGGELKILQWQAPTTLNMQLAGSFKDQLAACLVTEPLIHFLPDATPIPCLVTEVPSQANGLVSADLTTVTYTLLDGVLWSDGEPLTASDVVFTWKWIVDPANQSPNAGLYDAIETVEAVDDQTVKITFKEPQLGWNSYFSSGSERRHPARTHPRRPAATPATNFAQKPIGTGPYVVDAFTPNDYGAVLGQPELPRAEQALLRDGQSQRRGRCGIGGARRAADRGLGLRLEPAGRSAGPAGDGRKVARVTWSSSPARRSSSSPSTSRIRTRRSMANGRNGKRPTRSSATKRCARRWRSASTGRRSPRILLRPAGRAAGVQHPARHRRRHLAEYDLGVQPRQGECPARRGRLGTERRRAAKERRRP